MKVEFRNAFLKSYLFRLVVNLLFLAAAQVAMYDMLDILRQYNTDLAMMPAGEQQGALFFAVASYIFDETAIMSTQAGLMVVALMSVLFGLDYFKVKARETEKSFRLRLLLYTVGHLFCCLIMSLYLMCSVGVLAYPEALRLNSANAFIWIYPSYAVILVVYVMDLYKFFSKND